MFLERVYRRLLSEGAVPSVDGRAAVVRKSSWGVSTTVYDTAKFQEILDKSGERFVAALPDMEIDVIFGLQPAIVGYVSIVPPDDECWDAWQINNVTGPGKLVYGCAYATSPSGMLISDRRPSGMTPSAVSAWQNMSLKGTRDRKKLDDVEHPLTPETEDDCRFRAEDFLNYAYAAEGWENQLLKGLEAEHRNFKKRLGSQEDVPWVRTFVSRMDSLTAKAGANYFQQVYARRRR